LAILPDKEVYDHGGRFLWIPLKQEVRAIEGYMLRI